MKDVVKVSIAGIAFSCEQDAYRVLKDYLDKLEAGYAKRPDGREVVADIEARLSELLLDGQHGEEVVSRELAEAVVAQLGFPDDMDEDDAPSVKLTKRLYRNHKGAVLGGVCSGLGTYFKVDPVWVRLGFFMPLMLFAVCEVLDVDADGLWALFLVFVLLYFVLWVSVPMARTPRQKLEMQGERVTASSIHQTFADDASAMEPARSRQRSASVWADIVYIMGRILLFCLKAVVFLFAFGICVVALACFAAMMVLIFGSGVWTGNLMNDIFPYLEGISPVLYAVLVLLGAFIPLFVAAYFMFAVLFGSRPNRSFLAVTAVLWVALVAYLSVVTLNNSDNILGGMQRLEYYEGWSIHEIRSRYDGSDAIIEATRGHTVRELLHGGGAVSGDSIRTDGGEVGNDSIHAAGGCECRIR